MNVCHISIIQKRQNIEIPHFILRNILQQEKKSLNKSCGYKCCSLRGEHIVRSNWSLSWLIKSGQLTFCHL